MSANDDNSGVGRRELLKVTAGACLLGALGLPRLASGQNATPLVSPVRAMPTGPGHIVRVHMPGMKGELYPYPAAAAQMVEKAVTTLAGQSDPVRAWQQFVSPSDRVGIKINCLGTRLVSSMREVVMAVAAGVRSAGVLDENIVLIDMFAGNMAGGRYEQQLKPGRLRIIAHKDSGGGYGKQVEVGPARARFADIFTWTTAIINVPPIKDHDLAGVTCAMKNMTFGVVERPHLNHGVVNEAIARLYALDEIRSRVRLCLVDGTSVLCDGGPKANRAALVTHDSVYATTDPVAMDALAYELIEQLRAEKGLRTLAEVGRPPHFLELAEQLGLGVADRKRIELQTISLPPFVRP